MLVDIKPLLPFVSSHFFVLASLCHHAPTSPHTLPTCPISAGPKLTNSVNKIVRKSPSQTLFICQVSRVKASRLLNTATLNKHAQNRPIPKWGWFLDWLFQKAFLKVLASVNTEVFVEPVTCLQYYWYHNY